MRLTHSRVMPLTDAEFTDEDLHALRGYIVSGETIPNFVRTLFRAPSARKAFAPWGRYILSDANSLPARQREIVILRVGYLCRSGYEFAQHRPIALSAGVSAEEIQMVKQPAILGWSASDTTLLRSCDEIVKDHFVSDSTWTDLSTSLTERQIIDLVLTAGQYVQVCIMLNSFGVQLESEDDQEPEFRPPVGN